MASSPTNIDDGCRLCLNPFVESYSTIESPLVKEQMEKVFKFPIEFKNGLSSSICQSCSNTITDFYHYSEEVRKNQEFLEAEYSDEEVGTSQNYPTFENQIDSDDSQSYGPRAKILAIESIYSEETDIQQEQEPIDKTSKKDVSTQTGIEDSSPKKPAEDDEDKFLKEHFALNCDICAASVSSFTLLRSHFENVHHLKNAYVKCCNKVFHERSTIVEHIRCQSHHVCLQCKKYFRFKSALTTHIANEHFIGKHPHTYTCGHCKAHFSCEKDLNSHIGESHTKSEEQQCLICNQRVRLHRYQRHMEEVHGTTKGNRIVHKCVHCPRYFRDKSSLNLHMKCSHHECAKCHKFFESQLLLNKHIVADHRMGFVCEFCGKHFISRTPYELHVKLHKESEAPEGL